MVREADACEAPGEVGALLRREGLYSSHVSTWRKQMREGALSGLENGRGRKKDPDKALRQRVGHLEKENARLKEDLRRAATVIEVQKKLSEMLETDPESGGSA
jgi:transposase-like protein